MAWLLLLYWLFGTLALGFPLARCALHREQRIAVLVSFGITAGHCIQGIALMLLWRVVPLGMAAYVVPAAAAFAGLVTHVLFFRSASRPRLVWGLRRSDTLLLVALVVLFVFLGHRTFTIAYTAGDTETRFQHSGPVSWISRGTYPPTNPLEPDDALHYRIGMHVVAAAIAGASDVLPPEVLADTIAILMPFVVLALVGASIRIFSSPRPGMLASVLGLFAGSLLPYYAFQLIPKSPPERVDFTILVAPLFWHGNTLDMLHINPSIAVGFAIFAVALWLCYEALESGPSRAVAAIVATASLAYLGLTNEVYFAALVGGVVAKEGLSWLSAVLRRRPAQWTGLRTSIGMALAASVATLLMGGLDGGVSLVGGGPGSLDMRLNIDHLGSIVSPPKWPPVVYWLPILSPEVQLDSDFAFFLVPILVVLAWKTRRHYATVATLSSLASMLAWMTIYPGYQPSDIYRFGQAALTVYLTAVPFVLHRHPAAQRFAKSPMARRVTLLALAVLLLPHVVLATWMTLLPPPPVLVAPGSPDTLAAEYLRESTSTRRVFVPTRNPDGGWVDLYKSLYFDMTAGTLLAASGHAIPMGQHVGPHHPEAYRGKYYQASLTFDSADLTALKIDWVYVAPASLDAEQSAYLNAAERRGDLRFEKSFGEVGTPTERLLFRFTPLLAARQ